MHLECERISHGAARTGKLDKRQELVKCQVLDVRRGSADGRTLTGATSCSHWSFDFWNVGIQVPLLKFEVPPLKIVHRKGSNARGQEGLEQILHAALSVLVEEGYQALTMRRIASKCGLRLGNISYYFKSKDDLVQVLLDAIMTSYENAFQTAMDEAGSDPESRMRGLIQLILEDITTKKTTHVFPELWALSNHDPFVKERLYELYSRQYVYFEELIRQLNPALSEEDTRELAVYISAALEGMTVFAGHGKPWITAMPRFERIACHSFVELVKSYRREG